MDRGSAAGGSLYLVATPIGNLEDITLRALRILRECDRILAEDTRHARKLLRFHGIERPVVSYHEHNEERREAELLAWLARGDQVALVTDAGTPGISDPGFRAARAAAGAGHRVVPVPGPAAFLAALSAAALPTDRFLFLGFLPRRSAERRSRLRALREEPGTLIAYESPHRLRQTLADMCAELGGERRAVAARELTKLHEEIVRLPLQALLAHYEQEVPRGEFVLLVEGVGRRRATRGEEPSEERMEGSAQGADGSEE